VTTADGQVLGTTRIVDNGPAAMFWNIVLLGDGYRAQELATYHADAQRACGVLFDTHPFDQRRSVINVLRVDVTSTDSGADDPATGSCAGTGATARTYFDATFCSGGLRRLLVVNRDTALAVASDQVPEWSVVMLIVNSTVYGRSGGSVGVFSRAPQAQEIALHELGHLVPFRLAGEYDTLPAAGRRRSRHLLRSRAPRTERHQGVESRLHQVARPHRIRNAGAGDDQPGLHPVRPAAEPGTRGHGERLRGSQILPLWTVPPRVPLQNVRTRQAVLRGLPAQDPPGAPDQGAARSGTVSGGRGKPGRRCPPHPEVHRPDGHRRLGLASVPGRRLRQGARNHRDPANPDRTDPLILATRRS
jgi:hypothetical protein